MFTNADRCKIITIMHAMDFSEPLYNPVQAIKWARDDLLLLDFLKNNSKIPNGQCWRPPYPGWVKINTDGAVDLQAQKGGGWCCPVTSLLLGCME